MKFWRRTKVKSAKEATDDIDTVADAWNAWVIKNHALPTAEQLDHLKEFVDEDPTDMREVLADKYIDSLFEERKLRKICGEMMMVAR